MGKYTSKQLKYKKASSTYSVNLYTTTSDVGTTPYLIVEVSGTPYYAQLATPGTTGNSDLRVKKDGVTYAVNTKVEDPTMITSGGNLHSLYSLYYKKESICTSQLRGGGLNV